MKSAVWKDGVPLSGQADRFVRLGEAEQAPAGYPRYHNSSILLADLDQGSEGWLWGTRNNAGRVRAPPAAVFFLLERNPVRWKDLGDLVSMNASLLKAQSNIFRCDSWRFAPGSDDPKKVGESGSGEKVGDKGVVESIARLGGKTQNPNTKWILSAWDGFSFSGGMKRLIRCGKHSKPLAFGF